jgi:hypothetical protein
MASDPNAIYLVEFTDRRGLLWNRWFQFPSIAGYNVRSPAYPGEYYDLTITGGVPWTWDQFIQNLWPTSALGTYPGLPIAPDGVPENWNLFGVSQFQALNDALDHVGCTIAVDLTSDTQFTIVARGGTDTTFDTLTSRYVGRKEDDQEWIDVGSARVPGTVIVLFHRQNEFYGSEETIRNDNLQWQTSSVYQVSVAAPAFFTGAVGIHYLWSDYPVRYDIDNLPLAADVIQATAIAAERASEYFDDIYYGTLGYMRRVYSGIVPFAAGSQVEQVIWRQDFREPFERQGWQTEIGRGLESPW